MQPTHAHGIWCEPKPRGVRPPTAIDAEAVACENRAARDAARGDTLDTLPAGDRLARSSEGVLFVVRSD